MLPKKVYMVIRPRLFCWQTGEAFLFLLTVSLIKKVQKRYNQTTKGTEQSQYTDEYRNNFESCHNNAPPFLCIPASRSIGSGGYHPVMGTLPTCFHARILYHFVPKSSMFYRTLVLVFFIFFSNGFFSKQLELISSASFCVHFLKINLSVSIIMLPLPLHHEIAIIITYYFYNIHKSAQGYHRNKQ